MAIERKCKVIGSHEYGVYQLGALKGRRVLARFAKLIAPAFGATVAASSKPGKVNQGEVLERMLSAFVEHLSDEDIEYFCNEFGPVSDVTLPNGKTPQLPDIFDAHFSNNYYEMIGWLIFCFEVNFSSFFEKVGSLMPGVTAEKLGSGSTSRKA